jgi:hypothetical protein
VSTKTFGRFRSDALYLLPVYLRMKTADLFVDFAENDLGMKVAVFGTPVSESVRKLKISPPSGKGPNEPFLTEFVKREYPSFLER